MQSREVNFWKGKWGRGGRSREAKRLARKKNEAHPKSWGLRLFHTISHMYALHLSDAVIIPSYREGKARAGKAQ